MAPTYPIRSIFFALICISATPTTHSSSVSTSDTVAPEYGVDCSFPMQHDQILVDNPLGTDNRLREYENFMDGCTTDNCAASERDRVNMNVRQPPKMQNFTSAGYAKMSSPGPVKHMLQEFWDSQQNHQHKPEIWTKGATYINHWDHPTYMLPVPKEMEDSIVQYVQPVLERWIGGNTPLMLTSIYGIRKYVEGAVLSPHVDRLPLVTSCVLQVAQDVDEDWPLEVIGHDGKAVNITAHPGDMILYEGHSIIHGRPFRLKGRYYANIFLHFEPMGFTQKHTDRQKDEDQATLAMLYEQAEKKSHSDVANKNAKSSALPSATTTPGYVREEKASMWRQEYVYSHYIVDTISSKLSGWSTSDDMPEEMTAHTAAALGKIEHLQILEKQDPSLLVKKDANGWQPIHEAARGGHVEVIKHLVEKRKVDVNSRTNNGRGGTPLFWAEQMFADDHPAIVYLKRQGGRNIPPKKKMNSKV
mmetsp:Transcript_28390/g.41961  ORF Transcript_28390/g.41961 Transcript_28390/m.41961 type:complete len:473 (+) Transcript_28390:16-1434(+)